VYARDVNEIELTLVVSGLLWNRSLVMLDLETESLWSHILGEAKAGELDGQQLDRLPSVMTDWATWKSTYPESTVVMLSRTANRFRREVYNYPDQFVLGMSKGAAARAWSYDHLAEVSVVNDTFQQMPVVIFYEAASATAVAFERTLDGQTLSFRRDAEGIHDEQTGSRWNPTTGKSTSGPWTDRQLKPAVGVVSFRATWDQFYPDTAYWQK